MMFDEDDGSAAGRTNAHTEAYKKDPSIDNYVALRRSDPDSEIEISVIGGFDSLFYMRDEFAKYGLDPDLLIGVLDADQDVIGEVSLQLLEQIIATRLLEAAGATHLASRGKAIPEKLIDWIIACSLDALSWNDDLTIPRDLIVLIRERLAGTESHYEATGRVRIAKRNAAMVAGQMLAQGVKPTLERLGQTFGVSPTTVMRWFADGELQRESEVWSRRFDENGQLRPLLSDDWGVASKS